MKNRNREVWSLGLGLVMGALCGWLARRRTRERRLPQLDAWQQVLARDWGDVGAAILTSHIQAHYNDLYARRPHFSQRALCLHLERNLLPGLALYQVLLEETGEREAALAELENLFEARLAPRRRLMQLLAHLPHPLLTLLVGILCLGSRFVLPWQGWTYELTEGGRNCLALDVYRRFYLNVLAWYGAPELTAFFLQPG